ncbi:exopolysaccharide biosynthesis polyprenyl glycosylphosphotransferase [Bacteriovorax sp. Seq25_V]|uniref:exopolysaccharide biosynthesis polyprenyl glycosylphosphotransferase n=1 Tax=Bacteriovorax sp. Seq25_V TaxID=1201288 RepID=UPI00038A3557|nr:exopolysaccharide biosynthesis polyprenyl glycosylphosphotransferase [Bacteriovorax sp. Seq25_V]EQC43261.1 exopolysaccharide biosynthesis polyprenyl glycosylphosphotransferase [Bacteriovorax sp. Seq25_V]
MLKEYGNNISTVHRVTDVSIVILCWYASYALRFEVLPAGQQGLFVEFSYISIFIALTTFYCFEKFELYKSYRLKSIYSEISQVSKANFTVFVVLIFTLYFIRDEKISRIHLVTFFLLSEVCLTISRLLKANMLRTMRAKGKNIRYIKAVGDGEQLTKFLEVVYKMKGSGLTLVDDEKKADAFVVGYKSESQNELNQFMRSHYNDVREIHLLPEISYSLLGNKIEDFDGIPMVTVNQPKFPTLELALKRVIDLAASTIGLLLISPILIIIAILVKFTSKGPVLYGQERVGLDGKKFKMWKFRSMREAKNDEDKLVWSSKEDPRITKIGSFIRKTSIDELPQLFNILMGEMSLVGPRPERTEFVEKFKNEIPSYMLRHKMKAGLTGWAQVNGWRGDTDLNSRIECDLYYIKNWSIWLDIKIILLTFVKGFVNENAY